MELAELAGHAGIGLVKKNIRMNKCVFRVGAGGAAIYIGCADV